MVSVSILPLPLPFAYLVVSADVFLVIGTTVISSGCFFCLFLYKAVLKLSDRRPFGSGLLNLPLITFF